MQRHYETPVSPHAYVGQQPPNTTLFDFNQSVDKLFQYQTKLTHSTQQLYQQMTYVLENIASSSTFQENQQFINDILILKLRILNLLMTG